MSHEHDVAPDTPIAGQSEMSTPAGLGSPLEGLPGAPPIPSELPAPLAAVPVSFADRPSASTSAVGPCTQTPSAGNSQCRAPPVALGVPVERSAAVGFQATPSTSRSHDSRVHHSAVPAVPEGVGEPLAMVPEAAHASEAAVPDAADEDEATVPVCTNADAAQATGGCDVTNAVECHPTLPQEHDASDVELHTPPQRPTDSEAAAKADDLDGAPLEAPVAPEAVAVDRRASLVDSAIAGIEGIATSGEESDRTEDLSDLDEAEADAAMPGEEDAALRARLHVLRAGIAERRDCCAATAASTAALVQAASAAAERRSAAESVVDARAEQLTSLVAAAGRLRRVQAGATRLGIFAERCRAAVPAMAAERKSKIDAGVARRRKSVELLKAEVEKTKSHGADDIEELKRLVAANAETLRQPHKVELSDSTAANASGSISLGPRGGSASVSGTRKAGGQRRGSASVSGNGKSGASVLKKAGGRPVPSGSISMMSMRPAYDASATLGSASVSGRAIVPAGPPSPTVEQKQYSELNAEAVAEMKKLRHAIERVKEEKREVAAGVREARQEKAAVEKEGKVLLRQARGITTACKRRSAELTATTNTQARVTLQAVKRVMSVADPATRQKLEALSVNPQPLAIKFAGVPDGGSRRASLQRPLAITAGASRN